MDKLNYEQIMNIQESATKKLLNYIDEYFQNQNEIKSVEFYYPDFNKRRTTIAFNVWASLDYTTKYGKNFIQHFLEEQPHKLNKYEKDILIERNKSHISLFEVKNIKGDFIHVYDLICRQKHVLYEPELSKIIDKSELIFGRIAKVLVTEKFIGDISFLPVTTKNTFLENVFIDYNYIKIKKTNMTVEKYLRKYSLNLYKIYTDCIYDILGLEDKTDKKFSDELEEFVLFLKNSKHISKNNTNKHIRNLINIFEYFLYEKNFTLYDLDKVNLEKMFKQAIRENLTPTLSELNSHICTLKKYLQFLKNKNHQYKKAYKEILKIGKNQFIYFNSNITIDTPLMYDTNIEKTIRNFLNKKSINFLKDYQKYLFYIKTNNVKLTNTTKNIKRHHIIELNNIMYNKKILTKTPNQIDVPLLQLFYKFSLNYNILTLKKDKIICSINKQKYLLLTESEKLSLFINYIWNIISWDELVKSPDDKQNIQTQQKNKSNIISNLKNLKSNIVYVYEDFKKQYLNNDSIFEKTIIIYFWYIGLVNLFFDSKQCIKQISITHLGTKVFKILNSLKNENQKNKGKVIYLNKWEKNK